MLKKINVRDVRMDMYIHEICAGWMDHPFWKKSFMLEDPKELKILNECGIKDVWIDTDKGRDVDLGAVVAEQGERGRVDVSLQAALEKEMVRPSTLGDEVQRAQKIQTKARKAVTSMFEDAREGRVLELGNAGMLVDEISHSVARNPGALLSMARLKNKNDYAYQHSVSVCALLMALGKQLGLKQDEMRSLGVAGLMFDIGTMMLPDAVLNKPGKLTGEELELVRDHPLRGWDILAREGGERNVDDIVLDVCLHHHERMDGTGYPERQSGDCISIYARMTAVCDVYDAITSDRPYRKAMTSAEAIRKMAEWQQDGQFDQTVFHAFVKTVGIYPVGTLVKLKSGRLAVVVEQSAKSLLTPIVKVFFSTKVNEPLPPEVVDLSKVPDPVASIEDPARWKLDLKTMAGI
ncbi:MAG: HD-GYP domain-containing protein [Nitrosomonadales bacterium]|nr:HD-GYP domain-containing protein [Nitrosomonadales bacterium]